MERSHIDVSRAAEAANESQSHEITSLQSEDGRVNNKGVRLSGDAPVLADAEKTDLSTAERNMIYSRLCQRKGVEQHEFVWWLQSRVPLCLGHTLGWRHVQVCMAFLGFVIAYIYRISMSVAIVGMTDAKYSGSTYSWSNAQKSNIHAAFFWGYPWLQLVLGNIADKYGSKYIFIAVISMSALIHVCTVFVADIGVAAVVIVRILLGFAQGALYPCGTVLVSKWIPPVERGLILTFIFVGANVGTIVAFPLAGYLAATDLGWPLIFYVTCGMGLMWSLLFLWIGASSPSSHRFVSLEERRYIETSIQVDTAKEEKKLKTPWRRILLSLPIWALIVVHMGQNWGFWTLQTHMPNFIDKVLQVKIKNNGLLSALPSLAGLIAAFAFSWIAFAIQRETNISKTLNRKIWTSIAFWGDAALLILLGLIDSTNLTVAMVIFVSTMALNAAIFSGFVTSQIDLSSNFAGTVTGLENSIASVTSAVGPLLVGFIVINENSADEWRHVFILTGVIMFLTNLFYLIFGSAETQSWNSGEEEK